MSTTVSPEREHDPKAAIQTVETPPAPEALKPDPRYTVGTLTYTKMGLVALFAWLLWGDLVWSMMEHVFEASMLLQLDRLDVPKEWIGYLMVTVGATINMSLVPIVSVRSDRTRSRWGRRIPYILFTMPFLCIFLAVLGFSDQIGAWIRASDLPGKLHLSPMTMIIIVMGVLIVLFDVFNVFVNSVFWYLFRDVVPSAFLGRFMGAFRMVGSFGNMLWGWFVYEHIETHTPHIYLGAALIYFFGFGLMCLMVKEGEYPPPAAQAPGEPWLRRTKKAIATYTRQCFTKTHPVFVAYYISQAMFALAAACGMYKTLFYLRYLGFTTEQMGKFGAIMSIPAFFAPLAMGWLVDKIHPMRGLLIAATCVTPLHFAGAFIGEYTIGGFVLHAFTMYILISVVMMPLTQLNGASDTPLMMRLFPRNQYGQFSSANAMLRHFSRILGSFAGATFMGLMDRKYPNNAGTAYAFIWHGSFQVLAVISLWVVFFLWRKHGGDNFSYDADQAQAPAGKSA